jgi:hypothetical protein
MSENRPIYRAVAPPIEALVVDREALIRFMRLALEEMHSRRRLTPQCTGEQDIVHAIRYWDTVFGWVKQQHGDELVFITRVGSPGAMPRG